MPAAIAALGRLLGGSGNAHLLVAFILSITRLLAVALTARFPEAAQSATRGGHATHLSVPGGFATASVDVLVLLAARRCPASSATEALCDYRRGRGMGLEAVRRCAAAALVKGA